MSDALLGEVGEDGLIRRMVRDLPVGEDVVAGAGVDDCAVVRPCGEGWLQLLKTDCVVEGVHFLAETPPEAVGWKAMARVLSDMAAMAGEPRHALVTLMAPAGCRLSYVEGLYAGMNRCARRYGVGVVGGETTRGPLVMLSISMSGRVREDVWVRRGGAQPGDVIYVTGRLGGSIRGHHLSFEPRLAEAQWLARHFPLHAMMDVSDGLAKDLQRMSAVSGVLDYEIWEEKLPLTAGCSVVQGLTDGEDYELLFTVPAVVVESLEKAWRERFARLELTRVGRFFEGGSKKPLEKRTGGWDHFSA